MRLASKEAAMAAKARRMDGQDVTHVEDALERIRDARESLDAIDLRSYFGDEDVRVALQEARQSLKAAGAALRYAKTLEWRL